MRISDWSSDVCSSDLWSRIAARTQAPVVAPAVKNGHSPVARASAPVGAAFTLIALATGSLWGKPMWGTWWAWDARLTSFLILFFLYLGYIALANAFDDATRGNRAAAILALVGAVNLQIG